MSREITAVAAVGVDRHAHVPIGHALTHRQPQGLQAGAGLRGDFHRIRQARMQ